MTVPARRICLERQHAVVSLFRCGFLKVKDRAIKVNASATGSIVGEAYIDLQFEFYDDRSEAAEEQPLMATVNTKTNIQEG